MYINMELWYWLLAAVAVMLVGAVRMKWQWLSWAAVGIGLVLLYAPIIYLISRG